MGCNTTTEYGELVARVKALEKTAGTVHELAKRQMSIGDLLTAFDKLCRAVNLHTQAIDELQAYVQVLKNCRQGPVVVSVSLSEEV